MSEYRKNLKKQNGGALIDWNDLISMLSPESQTLVRDYLENMVNPQSMHINDFFNSSDLIIKCEKSKYTVLKSNILTLKAIKNHIICEDKYSYSVINASNMELIKNYKNS